MLVQLLRMSPPRQSMYSLINWLYNCNVHALHGKAVRWHLITMTFLSWWDECSGVMRWVHWEDGMRAVRGWDECNRMAGWEQWDDGLRAVGWWNESSGMMEWEQWDNGIDVVEDVMTAVGWWDECSGMMVWVQSDDGITLIIFSPSYEPQHIGTTARPQLQPPQAGISDRWSTAITSSCWPQKRAGNLHLWCYPMHYMG